MGIITITALAWFLAVTSGLMAGVYLAFSGFTMRSLNALGASAAIEAMNAVNREILRSVFMPLFFTSTLAAVLLAGTGVWYWWGSDSVLAVSAGLCYAIGMFGVTAVFNVPLNNQLARVTGDAAEAASTWATYLARWTRWNTVRTIASLVTLALSIRLAS